jgi:hypothetical protein
MVILLLSCGNAGEVTNNWDMPLFTSPTVINMLSRKVFMQTIKKLAAPAQALCL